MTLSYPLPDEYARAVQAPGLCFEHADLRAALFLAPPGSSVPRPAAGANAVVFRARVGDRDEAIRFLTREGPARERYDALEAARSFNGLTGSFPTTRWIDPGIRIQDRWWPLIRMDWVEGTPLDLHVEELVENDDRPRLRALASSWRRFVERLQTAGIAHGDLQHGNVLVDAVGDFHLVDLDAVWLPSIEHLGPPSESGHADYQPIGGVRGWGRYMDTFPALVIHLSLMALSHEPRWLWETYWTEQNLIFSKADYEPPFTTPIWDDLDAFGDDEIKRQSVRLQEACASGAPLNCPLEAVLSVPAGSGTSTGQRIPDWWTEIGKASQRQTVPPAAPKRLYKPPRRPSPRVAQPIHVRPGKWWDDEPPASAPLYPGEIPAPAVVAEPSDVTPSAGGYKRVLVILFVIAAVLATSAGIILAILNAT